MMQHPACILHEWDKLESQNSAWQVHSSWSMSSQLSCKFNAFLNVVLIASVFVLIQMQCCPKLIISKGGEVQRRVVGPQNINYYLQQRNKEYRQASSKVFIHIVTMISLLQQMDSRDYK